MRVTDREQRWDDVSKLEHRCIQLDQMPWETYDLKSRYIIRSEEEATYIVWLTDSTD